MDELLEATISAGIIEDYPNHRRGRCHLLHGVTRAGRHLHVVCTTSLEMLVIITVYEPRPPKWLEPCTQEETVKCSIKDCSGECQIREITHTVRHHGQVVVIDHVPAEVCSVCGDVVLSPETVSSAKVVASISKTRDPWQGQVRGSTQRRAREVHARRDCDR